MKQYIAYGNFYRYHSDTYIQGFIIADSHANVVKCEDSFNAKPYKNLNGIFSTEMKIILNSVENHKRPIIAKADLKKLKAEGICPT